MGWWPLGVTVCFLRLGRTVFYDAANTPKTQALLASYTRAGMTGVDLKRAGAVALLPGETSGATPPVSLKNCMVTATHSLNLRACPGGPIIGGVVLGWT